MAIQILPPQLANQIAAGEVVERPASVVKELVENCLDAGATRVDIDIEKGGAKLIRIQDNGSGIEKDDLPLALSRHATSKLHTLDDLEAILSFGFRGEALASISSVSRLTITSRTAEQSEAWLAYAEGSQMVVKLQPAAHPVGTTIEVVDLFFNTPARRRFLKSDKTEFAHIDEWLKRLALARPDVHLTLQHNGKMVRNYRPEREPQLLAQRLAQVCGRAFAEQAVTVECQHDDLCLRGYLQSPMQTEAQDIHYFYVNGRQVRDRLVNHAVRQAFADRDEVDQPGYVLMLQLDPRQVDVNVHPAKHEVRFHQARYVHDFILQALLSALQQSAALLPTENVPIKPQLSERTYSVAPESATPLLEQTLPRPITATASATVADAYAGGGYRRPAMPTGSRSALQSYGALLSNPGLNDAAQLNEAKASQLTAMPALLDGRYWVLVDGNTLQLLPIKQTAIMLRQAQILARFAQGLPLQPLLMPVAVPVQDGWAELLSTQQDLLQLLGFELNMQARQLIIKKVPPYLRDTQLANVVPQLLRLLSSWDGDMDTLANWIAVHSVQGFVSAPAIWQELSLADELLHSKIMNSAQVLPWQQWLES